MLIKNSNRAQIEWVKDRQHQSKSRLEFSFITPKLKGIKGCVICQIKANIFLY